MLINSVTQTAGIAMISGLTDKLFHDVLNPSSAYIGSNVTMVMND